MIALLRGTVAAIGDDNAVVVTGGIGLQVRMVPRDLLEIRHGSEVELYTYLRVREDALTLFGFLSRDDRDVFTILQGVTGVGPSIAMAALTTFPAAELRSVVAAKDEASLVRINGVGKKSAQKMIINIGERLGPAPAATTVRPADTGVGDEVVAALMSLGWQASQARSAIEPFLGSGMGTEEMLRAALIALGGNHG